MLIDLAVFLTINTYFATVTFVLRLSERESLWIDSFIEYLPAWMSWAAMAPPLFWFSKHVRMGAGRGLAPVLGHLGVSLVALLVYSVLALSLGVLKSEEDRKVIFYLLLDYPWYWWIVLTAHAYYGSRDAIAQAREAGALQTKTAELSGRLLQAELDTLKAQLHPHFLFNTHNAIAGLIRSKQDDAALDLLTALSDFLRYTLENRERNVVPLARELAFVRKYLDIQTIRFGDRLRVEWAVEDDCPSLPVPPLLLQPLIENAVHHGVSSRRAHNLVRVHAARRGDQLEVEIINSCGGESDHEGFGVGLENVHARLKRLYGDDYTLELDLIDGAVGDVSPASDDSAPDPSALMRLCMTTPIEHQQ